MRRKIVYCSFNTLEQFYRLLEWGLSLGFGDYTLEKPHLTQESPRRYFIFDLTDKSLNVRYVRYDTICLKPCGDPPTSKEELIADLVAGSLSEEFLP